MRYKFLVILISLVGHSTAQNLRPIPDKNLRIALGELGHITDDSLDLNKIKGRLQLDLAGKEIQDLSGLEYYQSVWYLDIHQNLIEELVHLPPNLSHLRCSKNRLSQLSNLPLRLMYLDCSGNRIKNIGTLPRSLRIFWFSDNQMRQLPNLPASIDNINYINNPIPVDSLPEPFRYNVCDSPNQNCLPNSQINWEILGKERKSMTSDITKVEVIFYTSLWGGGRKEEIIIYTRKDSSLRARLMKVRINDQFASRKKRRRVDLEIDSKELNQILEDMDSNRLFFEIKSHGQIDTVDLTYTRNGNGCFTDCDDCNSYGLSFKIFSDTEMTELRYRFNDVTDSFFCPHANYMRLGELMTWLYVYRLVNLTFSNHQGLEYFFGRESLMKVKKDVMKATYTSEQRQ